MSHFAYRCAGLLGLLAGLIGGMALERFRRRSVHDSFALRLMAHARYRPSMVTRVCRRRSRQAELDTDRWISDLKTSKKVGGGVSPMASPRGDVSGAGRGWWAGSQTVMGPSLMGVGAPGTVSTTGKVAAQDAAPRKGQDPFASLHSLVIQAAQEATVQKRSAVVAE